MVLLRMKLWFFECISLCLGQIIPELSHTLLGSGSESEPEFEFESGFGSEFGSEFGSGLLVPVSPRTKLS
jgi:hypothetical protein